MSPLTAQDGPLHGGLKIVRQNRDSPPCGVGAEIVGGHSPTCEVTLEDVVGQLTLATSLPVPENEVVCRHLTAVADLFALWVWNKADKLIAKIDIEAAYTVRTKISHARQGCPTDSEVCN